MQFACNGAVRKKGVIRHLHAWLVQLRSFIFLRKMFWKLRPVGLRIRVRARVERTNSQGSWEIAQRSMNSGAAGDTRTRTILPCSRAT
jgi:hypothetical protein